MLGFPKIIGKIADFGLQFSLEKQKPPMRRQRKAKFISVTPCKDAPENHILHTFLITVLNFHSFPYISTSFGSLILLCYFPLFVLVSRVNETVRDVTKYTRPIPLYCRPWVKKAPNFLTLKRYNIRRKNPAPKTYQGSG